VSQGAYTMSCGHRSEMILKAIWWFSTDSVHLCNHHKFLNI
jgi:hypothetical protein